MTIDELLLLLQRGAYTPSSTNLRHQYISMESAELILAVITTARKMIALSKPPYMPSFMYCPMAN